MPRRLFTLLSILSLLLCIALSLLRSRSFHTYDTLTKDTRQAKHFVYSEHGLLTYSREYPPPPAPAGSIVGSRSFQVLPSLNLTINPPPCDLPCGWRWTQQVDPAFAPLLPGPINPQLQGWTRLLGIAHHVYTPPPSAPLTWPSLPPSEKWLILYRTPIALTTILPITWIALFTRRLLHRFYRTRHGLCLHCGYDLRASKERCPECGNPIPPSRVQTPSP